MFKYTSNEAMSRKFQVMADKEGNKEEKEKLLLFVEMCKRLVIQGDGK